MGSAARSRAAPGSPAVAVHVAKILIVDDSPTALAIAAGMLEDTAHEVVSAGSWSAAVELVTPGDIDLILLDVDMPGVTGDALLEMMRKVVDPLPTVIYHSSLPARDLRHMVRRTKVHGYVEKGCTRIRLVSVIEAALEHERRYGASSSKEPPPPDSAAAATPTPASARGSGDTWLPRLLVVDDSITRRMAYSERFSGDGFAVKVARSGKEALEMLEAATPGTCPELILSDVNMPEMGGFELTRALKQDDRFTDIPVILYSVTSAASKDPATDIQALRAGASEYLRGAVDADELPKVVMRRVETMRALRRLNAFRTPRTDSKGGRAIRAGKREDPSGGRGLITSYLKKDPAESEKELAYLEGLLAENPEDPDILEWVAFRLYAGGHYPRAQRYYLKLIEKGHRVGVQNFHLGNTYAKMGRTAEAVECWKQTMALIPADPLARKAKDRVEAAT